jgi:hypothetical protein
MTTSEQAEVLHALTHLVSALEQNTTSAREEEKQLTARIDQCELILRPFQQHVSEITSHEHK